MADITVEGSIVTSQARGLRSIVFTSALVGYWFFLDSDDDFFYQKTTDGGVTWGSPVEIDTDTTIVGVAFDIWFDKWTPGNNGTKIHIAWTTSDDGDVNYRNLDTLTDTLSSQTLVFDGASAVAGRGCFVSITVARSGYIYVAYDIDAGAEKGLHRSTDGGGTWSASLDATFIEATLDEALLFPASNTGDNNDIWAVYHDADANALTLKMWDSSAAAAVESSTIQTYAEGGTDLTGQQGFSGSIRHSDGHLILTTVSERDAATGDHQAYDINGTGAIVTLTALTTNIDDHYHPALFIDQSTNYIYVFYNGKRDGSEVLGTTTKVYYTKSTDNGSTWTAGDTAYMEGAAAAVAQVWAPLMGPRLFAGWRVGTTLIANAVNSIDLTPPLSNLSYDRRRNPTGPMPWPTIERKRPVEPIIGDTLIALSGIAATLAAGVLSAALAGGLTGSGASGAVGIGPETFDRAISGTAATASISTSMGAGPELTGVSATASRGTLTASVDSALSGQVGTTALGTLATPRSQDITGVSSTSATGTLAAASAPAVSGLGATGSVGSISAGSAGSAALSGVGGTSTTGSFGSSTTGSETGVSGTTSVGSSSADVGETLSGSQASGSLSSLFLVGSVIERPRLVRGPFPFPKTAPAFRVTVAGLTVDIALSGVEGQGQPGDIDTPNDVVTTLSGIAAASGAGTLLATTPGTSTLTGVQATGAAGVPVATNIPIIIGAEATVASGVVFPTRQVIERPTYVTGPFPFLPSGMFQFRERARVVQTPVGASTINLIGLSATSALASATASSTRAFVGAQGTTALNSLPSELVVADYEAVATGEVGSLGLGDALSGVSASGQIGSQTTSVSAALTGVSATGSVRSLTATAGGDSTVGLTGLHADGSLGTLSASLAVASSGVSGSGSFGTTIGSIDSLPQGATAAGLLGTVSTSAAGAATLLGAEATADVGTVAAVPGPVLIGQEVSGLVGDLGLEARAVILSGIEATALIGSLQLDEGSVLDFVGQYVDTIDIVGILE